MNASVYSSGNDHILQRKSSLPVRVPFPGKQGYPSVPSGHCDLIRRRRPHPLAEVIFVNTGSAPRPC